MQLTGLDDGVPRTCAFQEVRSDLELPRRLIVLLLFEWLEAN